MATAKKATKKTKKAASKKTTSKKTTKKTTKKKTTKRASTAKKASSTKRSSKKSTTKKSTEGRALVCANGKECFWTTDGQVLRDLTELRDALSEMADDVFNHHVAKDRNDFADWVETVLDDVDCASALRRSKKPTSARTVVVRHLKLYSI